MSIFEVVLIVSCCLLSSKAYPDRPHIVLIVADDLGWNDVSFHGSDQIPTPNIDVLANDGIILNNYYVSPLCTPSRGSLFTGKYAVNLGFQHYVIVSNEAWGLPISEKTLPQYLKDLGYVNHGIGKWHLGHFSKEYLPTKRGFDSFFGYWTGETDYFNHFSLSGEMLGLDLHDNEDNSWEYNGFYSTELFTDKAKKVIEGHNSTKPLFLYLGHQAVHSGNSFSPLQAPPEYVKNFTCIDDMNRRKFAGMVSALDVAIGELLASLKRSNMLDNTVIIFTTDNGGAVEGVDGSTGSNWPLRGSKYTLWEGGVRGNAFIWSSKLRNQRRVEKNLFHISDWLPTIISAAGGKASELTDIDGVDQWQSLNGHGTAAAARNEILHNIDDIWRVASIRKGNFKLVTGSVKQSLDGWFDKQGKPEKQSLKTTFKTCHEDYERIYKEAIASKILRKYYYNENEIKRTVRRVIVNCGERPLNYSTNCDPIKDACLYNIQLDPCEYNNIANSNPQVVEELEALIKKYRKKSIPPGNKPSDPKANPKYHNYAWVPWLDEN